MARRDRAGADSAGVGPEPRSASRLRSIHDVRGLGIADGEPDIRGWEVRTMSGRRIGKVDDLLIDEERREVVMLDIDLQDGERHVEVPIRAAQLDRSRHHVIIDSADAEPVGEAYDRKYQDRLATEEREREQLRAEERDRDRMRAEERERMRDENESTAAARERMDHMSAEDRLRAAERMTGERTVRGTRTVREQGLPRRAVQPGEEPVEEVVVEQRPVVIEETVVRRRTVGQDELDREKTEGDRS